MKKTETRKLKNEEQIMKKENRKRKTENKDESYESSYKKNENRFNVIINELCNYFQYI